MPDELSIDELFAQQNKQQFIATLEPVENAECHLLRWEQ